jgi:ribosomal protein L40E
MDKETAYYIITYFSHLLSPKDKAALNHRFALLKTDNTHGRMSEGYQKFLTKTFEDKGMLSSDPEVLELLKDGYEKFEINAATRVLEEKSHLLFLNRCVKCGLLARTPTAQQCRQCGHDWHDK